jgi:dolichol-phosphate mannosyltransferase
MNNNSLQKRLAAVPVFNEPCTSPIIQALLEKVDCVLVVDDGSIEPIKVQPPVHLCRHSDNRGYGDAVNTAITFARMEQFDALVLVDGDGQHDIRYVQQILALLDNYDVAVGNRFHKNSKEIGLPQPIERREANDFMCAVFNRVYPIFQINDFFSGFLAFRLDAIPHYMDLRGSRYASPARMWPCLVGAGLRISEITIPCIYLSQNNNFLRQYSSMEDLGYHIIKEFIDSSIRHIGKPKEKILSSLFKELETGKYESIKSWLEPAFIRCCK